MAEHWTKALREEVAALRKEVGELRSAAGATQHTVATTGASALATPPPAFTLGTFSPGADYAHFYERLVTAMAASQGMSAFSPDNLAGVKANAAGACLLWQELCQSHDEAVALAHANLARRKEQEAAQERMIAENRAAREARRQRASASRGPVGIEQRMPAPVPGMSNEENALLQAAAAGGLIPAPDPA